MVNVHLKLIKIIFISGYADGATEPIDFPIAPKFSTEKLLKLVGMTVRNSIISFKGEALLLGLVQSPPLPRPGANKVLDSIELFNSINKPYCKVIDGSGMQINLLS